jgi:hypothetical protein
MKWKWRIYVVCCYAAMVVGVLVILWGLQWLLEALNYAAAH